MANLSLEAMQKEYMKVFMMLGIFTLLTVVAAKVHFPDSWGYAGELLHVVIGLAIAIAKAAMVVWIFMHIKFDNKNLRFMIYIPIFLFFVMVLSLTLLETFGRVQ